MRTRPFRWKGPELEALRVGYETSKLLVVDLAAEFRTSPGNVCRLVKRHGWHRRGSERLPEAAHQHWKWYRKLQGIYGRAFALEAIAGAE